jgi:CheY-like chemotaxis protein
VLVVDDADPFRAVLRDLVEATSGMTCAGEAASGEAALEALPALAPDLVIMDNRMPGIGGIEAAHRMRAMHPCLVVVLVSVEAPKGDMLAASGATAFLAKRQLTPSVLAELGREHGPG